MYIPSSPLVFPHSSSRACVLASVGTPSLPFDLGLPLSFWLRGGLGLPLLLFPRPVSATCKPQSAGIRTRDPDRDPGLDGTRPTYG
ncbi:hypothetical protein FIBSPDRAFT_866586 [Athelia psychrophila]|uniref:Uncharacterized protein n=1 Tax=Athelia psychrophila TaxID=1759441 RepID=A0A166ELB1_9AGAM|nr:hypothetical protein FIBSPDRAFT_866586 [Fibularhizoctonia sp. CBS 109695]